MRGLSIARSFFAELLLGPSAESDKLLSGRCLHRAWRGRRRTVLQLVRVRKPLPRPANLPTTDGLSRNGAAQIIGGHARVYRPDQQAAAVGGWHVDEEPVVVMVFLVEHANTLFFAQASDPEDRPSAKGLSVQAGTGIRT